MEEKSEIFVRLGLGEPIATSAVHGLGEVTLLETMVDQLKNQGDHLTHFSPSHFPGWVPTGSSENKKSEEVEGDQEGLEVDEEKDSSDKFDLQEVKISIVGKPNVGMKAGLSNSYIRQIKLF